MFLRQRDEGFVVAAVDVADAFLTMKKKREDQGKFDQYCWSYHHLPVGEGVARTTCRQRMVV